MAYRAASSLLALAGLSIVAASSPLAAQDSESTLAMCGKRTQMIESLSRDFKEAPMAVGQVDQSAVLEVFVSEAGTWTILATRTDGSSCIISAGEGWQSKTLITGRDA